MERKDLKKKIISASVFIVVGLVSIFLWQELAFSDGKLHVVFCDVGQGDAIFIRTPDKSDILIDGGPDKKVLDCLSNHMPFWDRTLELVILSHPHQDHFAGLIDVLKVYSVLSFATEELENKSEGFKALTNEIKQKKVSPRFLFSGDRLKTADGVELLVLAPSWDFLKRTSPGGQIGESREFGSLIILLSYGQFHALLTSDSQADSLNEVIKSIGGNITIDVLQVPHHGSKTGLDRSILDKLSPKLAVISVGKKNRYGHPHTEALKALRDYDIKILRTDENGEVEIKSDGDQEVFGASSLK